MTLQGLQRHLEERDILGLWPSTGSANEIARDSRNRVCGVSEWLALEDLWQMFRNQFKDLWNRVFLHFIDSGHHPPTSVLHINDLFRHFPILFLKKKNNCFLTDCKKETAKRILHNRSLVITGSVHHIFYILSLLVNVKWNVCVLWKHTLVFLPFQMLHSFAYTSRVWLNG